MNFIVPNMKSLVHVLLIDLMLSSLIVFSYIFCFIPSHFYFCIMYFCLCHWTNYLGCRQFQTFSFHKHLCAHVIFKAVLIKLFPGIITRNHFVWLFFACQNLSIFGAIGFCYCCTENWLLWGLGYNNHNASVVWSASVTYTCCK